MILNPPPKPQGGSYNNGEALPTAVTFTITHVANFILMLPQMEEKVVSLVLAVVTLGLSGQLLSLDHHGGGRGQPESALGSQGLFPRLQAVSHQCGFLSRGDVRQTGRRPASLALAGGWMSGWHVWSWGGPLRAS